MTTEYNEDHSTTVTAQLGQEIAATEDNKVPTRKLMDTTLMKEHATVDSLEKETFLLTAKSKNSLVRTPQHAIHVCQPNIVLLPFWNMQAVEVNLRCFFLLR